jgi:hypothetical protein
VAKRTHVLARKDKLGKQTGHLAAMKKQKTLYAFENEF